jgi:hypothetical protein
MPHGQYICLRYVCVVVLRGSWQHTEVGLIRAYALFL